MIYSYNQSHGKKYEDYLKGAFPGASDYSRSSNSLWDIERKFDNIQYLPTQIKTTGSNIIGLVSAPHFWIINEPFRMLIGKYKQVNNIKQFYLLYEFLITKENLNILRGSITYNEIVSIDNFIKSFKLGEHIEAREWAKNRIASIRSLTLLTLNHKIDSNIQRRLQCSVSINVLKQICKQSYFEYNKFYRPNSGKNIRDKYILSISEKTIEQAEVNRPNVSHLELEIVSDVNILDSLRNKECRDKLLPLGGSS